MKHGSLILIIAVTIIITAGAPGIASGEIKLGVLPRLGPVELFWMFSPLADYLSRETGEKVSIVIPRDFAAFKAAVKEGKIDIAFSNPLVYVQLREELKLEPLAVAAEKAGKKFRGIILARRDSGIETIEDLKGKKLVFVDRDSAGGYLFQVLLLHQAGLDLQKDLTILPFAKKHDNVVQAVFNRAADAGGIREDDLEKVKKVDFSRMKIIAHTPYYPNWPIYTHPRVAPETAARLRTAILNLSAGSPRTNKVLKSANLSGFETVSDRDYNQVREAARLVGAL